MDATYICDDFGSSNPEHAMGIATSTAIETARAIGLPCGDYSKFTQGFIHACQDRMDLVATGSATYDAGHACGMVSAVRMTRDFEVSAWTR